MAQIINIILGVVEAALVLAIFFHCLRYYQSAMRQYRCLEMYNMTSLGNGSVVNSTNEEDDFPILVNLLRSGEQDLERQINFINGVKPPSCAENFHYPPKSVFLFSFIVSAIVSSAIIVTSVLASFLFVFEARTFKQLERWGWVTPGDKRKNIPAGAHLVIDEGLATVLINLYIGINVEEVGANVKQRDLALAIGLLTVVMILFHTIIFYAIHISSRDGIFDQMEVALIKSCHVFR